MLPVFRIYFSFAQEDTQWMVRISSTLSELERQQQIKILQPPYHSNQVAGEIQRSDLVIALISSSYIEYDHYLIKKRRKPVLPILLSPCSWEGLAGDHFLPPFPAANLYLEEMAPAERDKILEDLAKVIADLARSHEQESAEVPAEEAAQGRDDGTPAEAAEEVETAEETEVLAGTEENEEPASEPLDADALLVTRVANDTVGGEDALGVRYELKAIARTIAMSDVRPPLVVGLMGGWGSGKSFAMHLICQELGYIRAQESQLAQAAKGQGGEYVSYVGHPYTVHFDAWTYAKSELWASLMQEIFTQLEDQVSLEPLLEEVTQGQGEKGGEIWGQLYHPKRKRLRSWLEHEQEMASETWQKLKQGIEADEPPKLWQALYDARSEARLKLEEAEQELREKRKARQNKESELAQLKKQMDAECNQALAQVNEEQVAANFLKEKIQTKLNDLGLEKIPGELLGHDFSDIDLKTLYGYKERLHKLTEVGLAGWRAFWTLGRENPGSLVCTALFLLVLVLIGTVFQNELNQWWRSLLAISAPVGLFGNFIYNKKKQLKPFLVTLVETLKKLEEELQEFKKKENVETERKKILDYYTLETKNSSPLVKMCRDGEQALEALSEEEDEAQRTVERQKEKVGTQRFPTLREFLETRLNAGDYREKLGLLHRVQVDLRDLTEALLEQQGQLFHRGEPRIVLFIDDLDRCPPHKVVEVLEATQLLCKTELFVVVLAVDMRYITRALEKEYEGILNANRRPNGLDYVEKIIQIPYQMHFHGADALLRLLKKGGRLAPAEEVGEENTEPTGDEGWQIKGFEVPAETLTSFAIEKDNHFGLGLGLRSDNEGFSIPLEILEGKQKGAKAEAKPSPTPVPEETERREPPQPTPPQGVLLKSKELDLSDREIRLLAETGAICGLSPRATKRVGNVFRLIKVALATTGNGFQQTRHLKLVVALLILSEAHAREMGAFFKDIRDGLRLGEDSLGQRFDRRGLPKFKLLGKTLLNHPLREDDFLYLRLARAFSFVDESLGT